MNRQLDIEKKVLGIFENLLELEANSISRFQTLEELQIDSIILIRLVVQCETELNIKFEDEMMRVDKFLDVDAFIKYIETMMTES